MNTKIVNLASPVNWNAPLNRGLSHWYLTPLGLDGGRTFYDLVSRKNGTLVDHVNWISPVTKSRFAALNFDGTNDYVDIDTIDSTGTKTFSLWFSVKNLSANRTLLFIVNTDNTNVDFLIAVVRPGGDVRVSGDNDVESTKQTSAVISANTLYHLTIVKTAGNIDAIYVNGINDTQESDSSWSGNTAKTMLGAFWIGSPGLGLFGCLFDLRVYNRALSADEAYQLYESSKLGYTNELNYIDISQFSAAQQLATYYRYNVFKTPILRSA